MKRSGQRLWERLWQLRGLRGILLLACAVAGVLWPLRLASVLPNPPWPEIEPALPDRQQTLLLAPSSLVPATSGVDGSARVHLAPRVLVYDPGTGQPLPGVPVHFALTQRGGSTGEQGASAETTTGDLGTAAPTLSLALAGLTAQSAPALLLTVQVSGPLGEQRLEHEIAVEPRVQVDLLTDRRHYRPGQTIHLLARVQSTGFLSEDVLLLTVADARGTLLCRAEAALSTSGLASAGCPLGEGALPGVYHVSASLADAAGDERWSDAAQVSVLPWPVSPPGETPQVTLRADAPFYAVSEATAVTLHAAQPWGAPLVDASLSVTLSLDGTPPQEVARIEGVTDARGDYAFLLDGDLLPDAALADGPVLLLLDAEVHGPEGTGRARHALPAAAQPLLIDLAAESGALTKGGALVPGMENRLSARVLYPDGRPAACALSAVAPGLETPLALETDPQGRASWSYRPQAGSAAVPWTLVARDAAGREAHVVVELPVAPGPAQLLLRPERDSYAPGETLHLDAWYAGDSSTGERTPRLPSLLYVDLVQDERPVGGDVVRLEGGHAALDLALPDDLPPGPLELIAYVVPSGVGPEAHAWGGDTRRVYLRPSGAPADADLGAGELDVRLYAQRTAYLPGEPASVSVRVSDAARAGQRSVLSVALVSAEASPALPRPSPGPQAGARGLAVLRSKVLSVSHPLPPGTERDFEAVARTRQVRRDALSGPATRIVWATLALVGLSWFAVAAGASPRTRRGWFARLLGGLLLLALAAGASLLLAYGGTLLLGPGLAILLCLLWLGALLAFGVQVVQRRDHWGQFLWAVTAATLALVLGLGYARQQGAPLASAWILAAWGAGLALALALYLYGLRWARGGAAHAAAAVWATASVLLITVASVALAPVSGRAVESAEEALATRVAAYRPADDGALSDLNGGEAAVTLPVVPSQPPSGAFRQVTALETAYWLPEARTTIYGDRAIEVPLPDLVGQARGAWRLAVHAWGPDGATGQAEMLLSLSRSLWIEAPLPAALTVGDELDLPVSVYNPLPITQTVSLAPREASWYSVRGSVVPTLTVPGRDVGRWVLPLTAREPGAQRLEVVASGEQGQDVYSAALWVAPSGGRVWRVYDGQLPPVQAVSPADSDDLSSTSLPAPQGPITAPLPSDTWLFRYPWLALRDTDRLTVTLYARAADVLAEGLAALPVPAHPVPLAELVAAARAQLVQPDALSERQAALLYQRILSYEAPEGGFGAWPGQAPDLYSSAEALACLHDLARVIYVDPALLDRTAAWLIAQQTDRNTWTAPALPSWERLPRLELPVTAHLAGSLIEAGYGETPEVRLAAEHLARYLDKAEDPYLLALVSHVLVAYDGARAASASEGQTARLAPPALDRLAELAQPAGSGEHRQVAWLSEIETWGGATGAAAGVESTALAVTALLRSEAQPELVAQALAWLVEQRDARGVWGAPQTQWLVVRALAAAAEQALSSDPDATLETAQVYVTVGEVAAAPQTLVRGNAQPEQAPVVLSFDGLARGYNEIVLSRGGLGEVRYRIVGSYWMPWDELPASSPDEGVSFGLAYSPTSSAVGEWIAASVTVTPTRESTAAGIVLELGLPPGMEVEEGAWQVLVEEGTVDRYQRVGQAMHVHLSGFPEEGLLEFSYRLRAAYPLAVWAPPSYAYPAGDPLRAAVRAPVWMEVH